MNGINFGTGGIPLSTKKRTTENGVLRLAELGLKHMELEFVHSVYLKEEEVAAVASAAGDNDISLSVHGSYYTNLASPDAKKWHASIARIVQAAERGDEVGAKSVTFHTGFFTGQTLEQVFPRINDAFTKILEKTSGLEIVIAPELTGKPSQFGDISELIGLVNEVGQDRVRFCIDFAHMHARHNGKFAKASEFKEFLDKIGDKLGEKYLQNLHMHMSAIEYGPKGERNHLTFLDSYDAYEAAGIEIPELEEHYAKLEEKGRLGGGKQDWQGLLRVLKEYGVTGYMVCESPNLEHDALLMSNYYNSL